jgi:hypothetical protein
MLIFDASDRCIGMSADAMILDQAILANSRAAIAKSLKILRESAPENYLGRNYYERRIIPLH